ncbi:hypothetical protein JTB14_032985 [Gonioctena quinquepunctata]|nr:hypothetical protein JTB14_032985 [Gonioctena quinquepunctata]
MECSFEGLRVEYRDVLQKSFKAKNVDLLEQKVKSFSKSEIDLKTPLDQTLRELLLNLLEKQVSVEVLREFVDFSILLCRRGLSSHTIPVVLLGDVFETLTLDMCESMFGFVEHNVHVWKEELFFTACKNNLLRLCNDLLRRLSRTTATVFCGKILLFLAKFFPFSERSGLNIVSEFNLENVTEYGTDPSDDIVTEIQTGDQKHVIDFTFYCKFWQLQDFFRNPNQCYSKVQWKLFSSHATSILNTFHGIKLDYVTSSDNSTNLGYFAKYLTSQKLLDLQLHDVSFRRSVLLQFLIVFQYFTSTVKFKSSSTMPKVKKNRKYSKSYTEEVVQAALKDINYGMPKKQPAMKYGIPRSTLQFRLSDKFTKIEHGPRTYLTRDEENLLESWILESHRKGFPKRKDDIQASVKSFLNNHPRSTPFKDNLLGEHWYQCFLQRYKKLSNRIPEAVTNASGNISESDIRKGFKNIEIYLKEKKYFDILEDPTRVYNGDETCFMLCPKEDKIILVSLYPNATRILHPADVSSFKPLKNAWKKAVINWRRNNPYVQLTKVNFASILEDALIQLETNTVSNGFRACGLFPWNANAIDYTKCLGKQKSEESNSIIFPEVNNVSLTFDEFTDFCDPETITEMKQGKPNEEIRGEMRHFKILQKIFYKFNVIEVDHRVRESSDMVIINDLPGQENIVDKSVPKRSEMVLVETSPDKEFEVDQSALRYPMWFFMTFPEHKENGSELNELSDMDLDETSLEVNPTKDINLPVVDSYLSESEINYMSIIILADHTSAHLEYTQLTTENPSTSFSSLTIVDNTMIKEGAVTYSGKTSHSEDCVKNKLKTSLLWPETPERKGKRTTEHYLMS